jgi:cob(I)alamin adenosyltransferase
VPRKPAKSSVYTRTGDAGDTALFGGRRVRKDHPRVIAYGTIDELNSVLGIAVASITQPKVRATLQTIQNELFNIGAELSSDEPVRRAKNDSTAFALADERTTWLEQQIDAFDAGLPKLKTFILPSGSPGGTALHFARTVARRAEREVVTLSRTERINPAVLSYLNRLCDLLFVLARYANKSSRRKELEWRKSP